METQRDRAARAREVAPHFGGVLASALVVRELDTRFVLRMREERNSDDGV